MFLWPSVLSNVFLCLCVYPFFLGCSVSLAVIKFPLSGPQLLLSLFDFHCSLCFDSLSHCVCVSLLLTILSRFVFVPRFAVTLSFSISRSRYCYIARFVSFSTLLVLSSCIHSSLSFHVHVSWFCFTFFPCLSVPSSLACNEFSVCLDSVWFSIVCVFPLNLFLSVVPLRKIWTAKC